MHRYILIVLAALTLAACDHGGGFGMDFDADPNITELDEPFEELSITRYVETGPEYIKTGTIAVSADRQIYVKVEVQEMELNSVVISDACEGSAELAEEDYREIVGLVAAVDLINYEPPVEGDEDCEQMADGDHGVSMGYTTTDEAETYFSTLGCAPEEEIAALEDAVNEKAAEHITDCTLDSVEIPEDDDEQDDEEVDDGEEDDDDVIEDEDPSNVEQE